MSLSSEITFSSDTPANDPVVLSRDGPRKPIRLFQSGAGWFPEDAGGLERMFYELTRHLPACGVDPHGIVVGTDDVSDTTEGRICSFAHPDTPLVSRALAARRAFQTAMARVKPDLVSAHFALYAAPWIDLRRTKPFVMHFHGPWSAETQAETSSFSVKGHLQRALERYVYRRADRCIVLSHAFANLLHSAYDVPLNQISIVPGGVDANKFDTGHTRSSARDALGFPRDRSILVSVRRLTNRMGLEHLIDAIAKVRYENPSILLLIAGKGPLQSELQQRIQERGLSNHVKLLGFVPDEDLPLLYRAADFSIVPTVSLEGFGLVTLESLASGTPVLVTPVGGMPEPLQPLSGDLILDGSAASDIAEGIDDVLAGHRVLPRARECMTYVRRHFDWPIIAERTSEVYAEVVARAGPSRP